MSKKKFKKLATQEATQEAAQEAAPEAALEAEIAAPSAEEEAKEVAEFLEQIKTESVEGEEAMLPAPEPEEPEAIPAYDCQQAASILLNTFKAEWANSIYTHMRVLRIYEMQQPLSSWRDIFTSWGARDFK